jgi:hypothetical protein
MSLLGGVHVNVIDPNYELDPMNRDCDGDGLLDGAEPAPLSDNDNDGLINARDPDSNNDHASTDPGYSTSDYDSTVVIFRTDAIDTNGDGKIDYNTPGKKIATKGKDFPLATFGSTLNSQLDIYTYTGTLVTLPSDTKMVKVDLYEGFGLYRLLTTPEGKAVYFSQNGNILYIELGRNFYAVYTYSSAGSDSFASLSSMETYVPGHQETYDWRLAIGDDSDFDGLSNTQETLLGTDKLCRDSDSDGVMDGDEPQFALEPDRDHDGLQDGTELGKTQGVASLSYDGVTIKGTDMSLFQPDMDPSTVTNPNNPDTDGDGLVDGNVNGQGEDLNCNGRFDRDILINGMHETDANDSDTDDDGIGDGAERTGVNGYGPTDPLSWDTDLDGLSDGTEVGYTLGDVPEGTDISAGHFRSDLDRHTTDPTLKDSDYDGIADGWVDSNSNGIFDMGEGEDRNLNGRVDAGETDPNSVDSDKDGLADGYDVMKDSIPGNKLINFQNIFDHTISGVSGSADPFYWGELSYSDHNLNAGLDNSFTQFIPQLGPTDPTNPDSDGDGLSDGPSGELTTYFHGTGDEKSDVDPEDPMQDIYSILGVHDYLPYQRAFTDPSVMDTDEDGLSDGMEVSGWEINIIHERTKERVRTIAAAETFCDPTRKDTDYDGIDDFAEFQNSSDPRLWDTDGDLILDKDEGPGNQTQIDGSDPVIVGAIKVTFVYTYGEVLGIQTVTSITIDVAFRVTDKAGLSYVDVHCDGSDTQRQTFDGIIRDAPVFMHFSADVIGAFWSGYDIKVTVADKNGNGVKGKTHLDSVAEAVFNAVLGALESFVKAVKELAAKALTWLWNLLSAMLNKAIKPITDAIKNAFKEIAIELHNIFTEISIFVKAIGSGRGSIFDGMIKIINENLLTFAKKINSLKNFFIFALILDIVVQVGMLIAQGTGVGAIVMPFIVTFVLLALSALAATILYSLAGDIITQVVGLVAEYSTEFAIISFIIAIIVLFFTFIGIGGSVGANELIPVTETQSVFVYGEDGKPVFPSGSRLPLKEKIEVTKMVPKGKPTWSEEGVSTRALRDSILALIFSAGAVACSYLFNDHNGQFVSFFFDIIAWYFAVTGYKAAISSEKSALSAGGELSAGAKVVKGISIGVFAYSSLMLSIGIYRLPNILKDTGD